MKRRTLRLLTFLVVTIACGGPTAPTGPLHAQVTDPAGDAPRGPFAPVPPDLLQATADVVNGTLTFNVSFAPGTFDPQTTWLFIYLDTDQNSSTGARVDNAVGADYWLDISDGRGSVAHCPDSAGLCSTVATAAVTFVADGVGVSVPLSVLGNDDGKMNFRMYSHSVAIVTDTDYMPDLTRAPGSLTSNGSS